MRQPIDSDGTVKTMLESSGQNREVAGQSEGFSEIEKTDDSGAKVSAEGNSANTACAKGMDSLRKATIGDPLVLKPYRRLRWQYIFVVFLQLAIITGVAAPRAMTLATGRVVTLQMAPVDPWDVFRGDYVTLSPKISRVTYPISVGMGQRVYVVLVPDGAGSWKANRLTTSKSQLAPNEVQIIGTAKHASNHSHTITYGIEQVFIPERTGKDIRSDEDMFADVAIDNDGNAVIKTVRYKGAVIYDAAKALLAQ